MDALYKERAQIRRLIVNYHTEMVARIASGGEVDRLHLKLQQKADKLRDLNEELKILIIGEELEEGELEHFFDEMEPYEDLIAEEKLMYDSTKSKPLDGDTKNNRKFKLPSLELKTFSSDLKEWLGFWGQFSKIDQDKALDDTDKFQYLIQATRGQAREIVESYPPSGPNYHLAVKELKERFAKPESLIEVYVRELLNLVLSSNKTSLASLYTYIITRLRALGALGVSSDKYATILYPLIESILPEETNRIWQRSRGVADFPTHLDNLMAFLKKEVEVQETVRQSTHFGVKVRTYDQEDECPSAAAASLNIDRYRKPIVLLLLIIVTCQPGSFDVSNETASPDETTAPPIIFSDELIEQPIAISNVTIHPNSDKISSSNVTFKVNCFINTTDFEPIVEIANSSQLLNLMPIQSNITSLQTPATCFVVLFYSPACPFSCLAAPHFNALPRAFPKIQMAAVDTSTRYNFNAQFGIVGVPSLLLFHNGRPAARFNNTSEYNLETFVKFIVKNTGLKPEGNFFVTSADFAGPISSVPVLQTDFCLILSWCFLLACALYFFYYSPMCQWVIDSVRSAWMEAEAHQHSE